MIYEKWQWLTRDEYQGFMLWDGKPVFDAEFSEWEDEGGSCEWCNDDVVQVPCEEREGRECIWQRNGNEWILCDEKGKTTDPVVRTVTVIVGEYETNSADMEQDRVTYVGITKKG